MIVGSQLYDLAASAGQLGHPSPPAEMLGLIDDAARHTAQSPSPPPRVTPPSVPSSKTASRFVSLAKNIALKGAVYGRTGD
jgi:hypothetical protein